MTEGCTPLPVGHPPLQGGREILLILKCFYYNSKENDLINYEQEREIYRGES